MVPKKSGKQRTENKITQRDKKIQHTVHIIQIDSNECGGGRGGRATVRRPEGKEAIELRSGRRMGDWN